MRIAVGGYIICVNSFSSRRTEVERCQQATRTGEAVLAPHRGGRGALGGFLAGAEAQGIEVVPLPFIAPGLWGLATGDAQAWCEDQFRRALHDIGSVDGVFLQLHGGGAGTDTDDCEGALCAALREVLGERRPLLATLDGHANISPTIMQHATALIGVKTNPHYDFYERGWQAAQIMAGTLSSELRPTMAVEQPPFLPSLQKQRIAPGWPMEDVIRRGRNVMRNDPRILDVTTIGGWAYADAPTTGFSVLVTTNDAPDLARDVATTLRDAAWEQRQQFQPQVVSVQDAVREAMETDAWPVVLGDVADSGGAGTAGDGTALLRELLEQGAHGVVIGHLVDPEAVAEAVRAGVGNTLTVAVGGKTDAWHGDPVMVTGKVRSLHDGDFTTSTRFNAGRQRRGTTAVVVCEGVEIILTSRQAHSFEPNTFRSVGIEPTERRILVAKSEMQHRAGLEGVGKAFIDVDTPGISTPMLSRLPYTKIRRPVFPLDAL
jgi:microcystin degradation protein MlrC